MNLVNISIALSWASSFAYLLPMLKSASSVEQTTACELPGEIINNDNERIIAIKYFTWYLIIFSRKQDRKYYIEYITLYRG
jgi:hypothetical protein